MPGGAMGTGTRGGVMGQDDVSEGSVETADLANDAVSNAKLRNSGALSVIGRSANSTGDPADISATAGAGGVLRESGNVLGFGTITLAAVALASSGHIPYSDGTTLVSSAEISYATATGTLDVAKSRSGAAVTAGARNTSNTASSDSKLLSEVAGTSAGDAVAQWSVSGTTTWTAGIDNSTTTDHFVLAASASLGTTDVMSWSTGGDVAIGATIDSSYRLKISKAGSVSVFINANQAAAGASLRVGAAESEAALMESYANDHVGGNLLGIDRAARTYFYSASTGVGVVIGTASASGTIALSPGGVLAATISTGATDGMSWALGTTTGWKIGTATTQKIGFYNATPVTQRANVADPSGGGTQDAEARAAIISVITGLEQLGLFAAA